MHQSVLFAKSRPPEERRRATCFNRAWRVVWDWVFENDLGTCEKLLTTFYAFMALGVGAFSSQIVAQPPPVWQLYALALPAWLWSGLLMVGVVWQLSGRGEGSKCFCTRRNGAVFSFFVSLALCGPLFVKGPGLACMVMGATLWQIVVAGRLWHLCAKNRLGC
jgi:hypothetical protein